jgi:phage repressor protein C with HTH and peptisase S24 domain
VSRSTRALAAAAVSLGLVAARLRLFPVRVAGDSMAPTLRAGDLLAVSAALRPRPGDVVVARARGMEMVKRVAEVRDRVVALEGDNRAATTDIVVEPGDVAGVVLMRYRPRFTMIRRFTPAR